MTKRIEISVSQEDVQNIIDCYEKDIKYIEQLETKINELENENIYLKNKYKKIIDYINCALDEEKETPSTYGDWRLDILDILVKVVDYGE